MADEKRDAQDHKPDKKVKVEIDNHPKQIEPGEYVVSDLKERLGVPADKDLDQVIEGTLTTLVDTGKVTIRGGEVFFSHVRRGGSS